VAQIKPPYSPRIPSVPEFPPDKSPDEIPSKPPWIDPVIIPDVKKMQLISVPHSDQLKMIRKSLAYFYGARSCREM